MMLLRWRQGIQIQIGIKELNTPCSRAMQRQATDGASAHAATAQAMGQALQKQRNNAVKSANSAAKSESSHVSIVQAVWQHPYVDVFKHFKIMPLADWKNNKRQGDVQEAFAREIGRKVMCITGSISANNFIQIPHPNSMTRSLGLTGRYLYLQAKAPLSQVPLSFHIDLAMADRTHGIRISASNLYKTVSTQNGFVIQLPLNLDLDRWTVIVFDIVNLLKLSRLLPQNYIIEGSFQIKSLTLCANSVVRGIFTSENEYDFVTLPPDLRFKFSFDINRWPEYFAWLELPNDLRPGASEQQLAEERARQTSAKAALAAQSRGAHMTAQQKQQMQMEIDALLTHQKLTTEGRGKAQDDNDGQARYDAIQAEMQAQLLGNKDGHAGDDLLSPDELMGFGSGGLGQIQDHAIDNASGQGLNIQGLPSAHSNASNVYKAGMYIGEQRQMNGKFNIDPIMELRHIIGYSPSRCLSLKWSRIPNENTVLFTSCGSLIAMDVETSQQKRFFFGHSAPICCFDVAQNGHLIASAQEGKNSIIRIWDYHNARCLQMLTMPVTNLQCLSFSPDGRFLACVGKEGAAKRYGKEMIIVWDISRIHKGEKADILAKQVSEFNILDLKFSPVDNYKLISCGKQNIRFWRIKETRNIRGSAVVLNQYARDTVFTCLDFELSGVNSGSEQIEASSGKKKDGLRRVYVATKSGMVYQVNYDEETLEATYRANDSAIYSISINQAFCVTGSEDQYLRIWTLDFNEFLMEAKHEGTVCAVDISADGLRVACGTLNGSLGILNKSNQRYQTLLRSHTASIVSMDFHLAKKNVITVSLDDTIRLWDLTTFDQVVEFSSPIDQPLCVAAHPTLPIFSCGFQSGTMRVFDIEKTCVCDNFTQFSKPIRAIAYSPNGDLLVTCCEDGSIALHNARRQHLPTKIMNLEFKPEFVHVAFSQAITRRRLVNFNPNRPINGIGEFDELNQMDMNQSQSMQGSHENISPVHEESDGQQSIVPEEDLFVHESLFGIMGEYGNNIMVYSSDSIILKHQINVGCIIRSFQFTKNNREMIVVTKDQRIRIYSLASFEGVYLRELQTVHKGAVTCTDLSKNGGYMLTGGQDNLLKMWDYEAQKTVPYYFQAFIGHTYPLVNTMFNPLDNGMVISAAENDGIYIWSFAGDIGSNFHPVIEQEDQPIQELDRDELHQPTVLERMRQSVKDKRKPKLAEFSFILPEFKIQQKDPNDNLISLSTAHERVDTTGISQYYQQTKRENNLAFNQYVSVTEVSGVECQVERGPAFAGDGQGKIIEPVTVNGYDGFSGVHDNLIWTPINGMITYTLHNKIIIENTRTRIQTVIVESEVRLSTLAQSSNDQLLAAAEGEPSKFGNAVIYLFDLKRDNKLLNKITFFRHGVQSMAFSKDGRYLIAASVPQEGVMAVFDVNAGLVAEGGTVQLSEGMHITSIVMNPFSENAIDFCTVGQSGNFHLWMYFTEGQIRQLTPEMNMELQNTDFTCATYTPKLPHHGARELIMLGTSDGGIVAVDPMLKDGDDQGQLDWLEHGKKELVLGEPISAIVYRYGQVVISGAGGNMIRYADKAQQVLPPDADMITRIKTDEPIMATQMDDKNEEGIIGAADGSIKFIQFKDEDATQKVNLVTKMSPYLDSVKILDYDKANPNVFLSSVGKDCGDMKLLTAGMLDHIYTWPQYALGPVKFVASSPKDKKNRMIGHQCGFIRIIQINSLKTMSIYRLMLDEGETLSCGCYSNSGHNFAIGTSFGKILIGMMKKDPMANTTKYNLFISRVSTVSKTTDNAVTSLQMTSFDPLGTLLAAFDDGKVRCWNSQVSAAVYEKKLQEQTNKRNRRRREAYDLADLGEVQFDVVDKFDMFENPHGNEELTEEDIAKNQELYGSKTYENCEAMFNNAGSHSVEIYFSYVSALQYIFVRNYRQQLVLRRVALLHFPMTLNTMEYNRLANEAGLELLPRYGIASLLAVGTKEGKVLIYRLASDEAKLLLKTRSGVLFGGVTAQTIQDNGNQFIVASSTGEIVSFNLMQNLREMEQ